MDNYLDKLLSKPAESEILEFKEAKQTYSKDKLGKYFSALSNEANLLQKRKAYILFGVDDNIDIVGTHIEDRAINDFKRDIAEHTSPKLSFIDVKQIHTNKGKVIVFEIPPAPRGTPVSWKGHRYGRYGESLGALSDHELLTIYQQTIQTDWSKEIIEDATIEDLDKEAIVVAREHYKEKNPKLKNEIEEWDEMTFLNKAKICIKGKITNTAILLLGKPESEHLISPATSRITWVLRDKDNIEKDYAHFSSPLLLAVDEIYSKIRNLKYRYIKDGTLFPDEVDQYDPFIIRESLNNCIAHQDYTLGGRVTVVESEDGFITFTNKGVFIPESVEYVIEADSPELTYRNPWLATAMVNLNMIDTVGSGIKKMFRIQREKYFPMPDYDLENEKVQVQITGKVLDINYARKVAELPTLTLKEIIALDKVSKKKPLTDWEIKTLRNKNLIEGRKPNFHISSKVAQATGEKAEYIEQKGFDDAYYEQLIIEHLKSFDVGDSSDFRDLLYEKFPKVLDRSKKDNKLRNMLQRMKRRGVIETTPNRKWKLV